MRELSNTVTKDEVSRQLLTEHCYQQRAAAYMHDPAIQNQAVLPQNPNAPPHDEVA